jgi:hypothetical protein
MKFEFRPEFRIDLKLEVVWPKLKGAFRVIAAALKGLVLPGEAQGGQGSSKGRARFALWCLAALFIAAAVAAAIFLVRR